MKKIYRSAFAVLTLFIINICFITGYYSVSLPDSFYVSKGSSLKLSTKFSIEASGNETVASFAGDTAPSVETANLKLFGLIPVKLKYTLLKLPFLFREESLSASSF